MAIPYMQRALTGASLLLLTYGIAAAQTRDPRVDDLIKETAQLKQKIADQDARITELERAVKFLQSVAAPAPPKPEPIPAPTPAWHRPVNWTQIKTGMSEADVVAILGPPTSVDSSIDSRTLVYAPDAKSTSTLKGSVTLVDDRVSAMTPPAF
jgi:hypothetical protein